MGKSHNVLQRFLLKHPRPVGAAFAALGAELCYRSLIRPIQLANAGAPEVRISGLEITLALVCTLTGVVYLVFGVRFARIFHPAADESKRPVTIVGFVIGMAAIGIYIALSLYANSKGYIFD